jgi:predicted nucleotide-binding protein
MPSPSAPDDESSRPRLLVPFAQMDQELADRVIEGAKLLDMATDLMVQLDQNKSVYAGYLTLREQFLQWDNLNEELLSGRFSTGKSGHPYRREFVSLARLTAKKEDVDRLSDTIRQQLLDLSRLRDRLGFYEFPEAPVSWPKSAATPLSQEGQLTSRPGDEIFIVHGHDGETKLQVAQFIERITGKRPVILHEQADSGRTVIEKFEEHASGAGFAIILLTADDEGRKKGAASLNPRARQNVVLEFGYFMAKLGRSRVVAIHEADVELPSDVSGLLYKSLSGNWHTELARELAAHIEIDFSKLY